MPYVITTSEPFNAAEHVHRAAFTRRAVATLEEARLLVAEQLGDDALKLAEQPLATTGGTVGPLPDGTVIEVAPVEWGALIVATGVGGGDKSNDQIIDAYNARQA